MKRIYFLFIFFLLLNVGFAQSSKTVNASPGNLWSLITPSERPTLSNLTITGSIDTRDFVTLRDSLPQLTVLNLSQVSISNPANAIPANAFFQKTRLTSVVLPNNVITVEANAFNGCTGITAINFPASLTTIDITSFRNFGGLFSVAPGNPNFSALNGVLYNKNQSNLIQAPVSLTGAYTIPAATSTINQYAFYGCNKITDISSLTTATLTIEESAFQSCTALLTFTTTASNTIVGYNSFASSGLTTFTANSVQAGNRSFLYCSKLTNFNASIIELSDLSFYGCTKLSSVNLVSPLATISPSAFAGCTSLTTISLPASVTSLSTNAFNGCTGLTTVTGSVINVGNGAFNNCTSLTSVNATLADIGGSAFNNCAKLTVVQFSSTLKNIGSLAFFGCSVLPAVNIPASATNIQPGAFRNCFAAITVDAANPNYMSQNGVLFNKNKTVLIQSPTSKTGTYAVPDGVTRLGDYSFSYNSRLILVQIPKSVCEIGESAFYLCPAKIEIPTDNPCLSTNNGWVVYNKDSTILIFSSKAINIPYTLPNTVDSICPNAFNGCDKLPSITLNNGLRAIGASAFASSGINAINIPNTVKSMGIRAFENCNKALSLKISTSLSTINNYAFSGCNSLTAIDIPANITSLGNYAFSGCSKATSIKMPSTLTSIGAYAFSGCTAWTGTLTFPAAITSIGGYAFNNCSGLTGKLDIPSSITVINDATFAGCTGFTSINIPSSVTSIGVSAFYNCRNVPTIIIPSSVTAIKQTAFYNCIGLVSLYANSATPVDLTSSPNVFLGVNKKTCTLYVPAGSKRDYQKANQWRDFFHIIEGEGFWIDRDTLYFPDVATKDSILIGSNTNWTTTVLAPADTWLSSSPASGSLQGKIYFSATENQGNERIGYVVVRTKDSMDSVVVFQSATKQIPNSTIKITPVYECDSIKYRFTVSPITTGNTYEWDFGDGKKATGSSVTHVYTHQKETVYNIELNVRKAPYYRTFKASLKADALPNLVLDNKPYLCYLDRMIVHVSGADSIYLWSDGSKADSLIIIDKGEYSVQGINKNKRCKTVYFKVDFFPTNYTYDIQMDKDSLMFYQSYLHVWVNDIPGSKYYWTFGDGGKAEGADVNYYIRAKKEGDFKIDLVVTTPDGCTQHYSKSIPVVDAQIPNTFTPNGDGQNDIFLKNYPIKVYDRAGRLLYEGSDGWDGKYKGEYVPQNTYYYILIYSTPAGNEYISNYVTVIR